MTVETLYLDLLDGLSLRSASGGGHELEGLCVPYDRVTTRAGVRPELFRPGSLKGATTRANKIRLLDENHQRGARTSRRPVGVGVTLTELREGLHGVFRFYNTPQGRAAYENVHEGTYGGLSVGFAAVRESAPDTDTREIYEARLHHVSLVDDPAYEDARILAVRSATADYSWVYAPAPAVTVPLDIRDEPPLTVLMARTRR